MAEHQPAQPAIRVASFAAGDDTIIAETITYVGIMGSVPFTVERVEPGSGAGGPDFRCWGHVGGVAAHDVPTWLDVPAGQVSVPFAYVRAGALEAAPGE